MSDGTTDASLNVDTNEAICNECGECISHVSEYSKLSMKTNGDILRSKKRKAFVFQCGSCDKHVEAVFKNSILVGKECSNDGIGCKIDITDHMQKAIQETSAYLREVESHDNSDE
tara:strand:- start:176 stop:520 length:345 start_codon:yes stop_codon:yes gene_type:complete